MVILCRSVTAMKLYVISYSDEVVCCRFINARRRVLQPAAAAAADVAMATDNQESSAAKRMKTMLESEARSQFWLAPPRATSVGYTSHAAAAAEEPQSLSSTPSSTVSVC